MQHIIKEITTLQEISSKDEKKKFLESISQDTLNLLIFLLDKSIVTNISTTAFNKDLTSTIDDNASISDINDLINKLPDCSGKNIEIAEIQHFANSSGEFEFIKELVTKKLKVGVSHKTLNKVYPGSIYVHEVQLAAPYAKHAHKLDNQRVTITQKLDGVRITAFKKKDKVIFITRQGHKHEFPELEQEFLNNNFPIGIYDGEVIAPMLPLQTVNDVVDSDDYTNISMGYSKLHAEKTCEKSIIKYFKSEFNDKDIKKAVTSFGDDFPFLGTFNVVLYDKDDTELYKLFITIFDDRKVYNETMKIMGTDDEKKTLEFHVFDYLTGMSDESIYADRHEKLSTIFDGKSTDGRIKKVNTLEHNTTYNEDVISNAMQLVDKNDWEGVMINTANGVYKHGRTDQLLKVKKFETVDLKIIDINIAQDGQYKGQIKSLIVDYKGFPVGVGSGLTASIRLMQPSDLIGRIVEVQYFEETVNKNNNDLSLKFPVFKHFRDDKTEPSYN